MKHTLTLLALMIAVAAGGQKPDTLRIDSVETITIGGVTVKGATGVSIIPFTGKTDGKFIFDTTDVSGWRIYDTSWANPKYDTVAIVYLYCDTAKYIGGLYGQPVAFWDFGYEVIEGQLLWRIANDGSRIPMFKTTTYLDRDKQPIRKSIIIWQTKNIEK